jgi:hypothetical protein
VKEEYRIGYPKAFLGFGKFTCTKPTVRVCELCPGVSEVIEEFGTDYEPILTVCPLHYNQKTSAQLGEQLVAA